MERPKVSVVLSIYNVEKYIDRCMETVLNQTLKDIEIIMVDDESPDRCPQICDEYAAKDSRVKVIHKKNGGLGYARNSGMEAATGEFICFPDPDDYFDLEMLEYLYITAKQYNLQVVLGGLKYVTLDEKFIKNFLEVDKLEVYENSECINVLKGMIAPDKKHNKARSMSCARCLFDLDFLRYKGLYFESERMFISEDMIFDIDLYTKTKRIGYVPKSFYFYRMNPQSLSHTFKANAYVLKKNQYLEIIQRFSKSGFIGNEFQQVAYRYLVTQTNNIIYQALSNNVDNDCIKLVMNDIVKDKDTSKIIIKRINRSEISNTIFLLYVSLTKGYLCFYRSFVWMSKVKNKCIKWIH